MDSTRSKSSAASPSGSNRNLLIIGVIVGVAVVIAAVAIALSQGNAGRTSGINYSQIPQSRLEDGGFVLGNPEAPITIIEFADYFCPHCQDYKGTMDRFINDFVVTGQARFEFRVFPTAGSDFTFFAGNVSVCMEQQKPGAYWEVHDILFARGAAGEFGGDMMRSIAQQVGVDYAQALACSSSEGQVANDIALGQSLSVSGTPAVRMRGSDGVARSIVFQGQSYDRGGPSYDVLAALVTSAAQ